MTSLILLLSLCHPIYGGYTPVEAAKVHYDALNRAYPLIQNLLKVEGDNRVVEKTIEEVAHKTTNGNNFAFRLRGGVCFETYEAFDGSDFAVINVMHCTNVGQLVRP